MKEGSQFRLPHRKRKSRIEWITDTHLAWIVPVGLAAYGVTVTVFSAIEYALGPAGHWKGDAVTTFGDLVYFNFISILTIGYGDFAPRGIFRTLTIVEALIGLAIYSVLVSVITIKLLLPRKNIVVFSRYGYYCQDDEAFMVIYLNTASINLVNVFTSWYFKQKRDWQTQPQITVPFITQSVQTFQLPFPGHFSDLVAGLHSHDTLRFGLTGSLGVSIYSTSIEYRLENILVIPNRSVLLQYEGFYRVNQQLDSPAFREFFHYNPAGAKNLADVLAERDATAPAAVLPADL